MLSLGKRGEVLSGQVIKLILYLLLFSGAAFGLYRIFFGS